MKNYFDTIHGITNHQDQDKIFLEIGLKTIGKKKIVAARKQYGEEEGGGLGTV